MKKLLGLALLATASMYGMESIEPLYAARQDYPKTFGYVPLEELVAKSDPMPEMVHDVVTTWYEANPNFAQESNTTVALGKCVIKNAGTRNTLITKISSLGYDPYGIELDPQKYLNHLKKDKTLSEEEIEQKIQTHAHKRAQIITDAKIKKIDVQQALSSLAGYRILKQANNSLVQPVGTYVYHKPGHSADLTDENYLVVQDRAPDQFKLFSTLLQEEKMQLVASIDIEELFKAVKNGCLWDPSENNIWTNGHTILITDLEKPNNEGSTPNARWKVAEFGQDKDKYAFNIRHAGHPTLKTILQKYAPDKVEKWDGLLANDPDLK